MQKLFSDRDFWITGLTIAATLMLVSAAHFFLEMREVSVMQDRADLLVAGFLVAPNLSVPL